MRRSRICARAGSLDARCSRPSPFKESASGSRIGWRGILRLGGRSLRNHALHLVRLKFVSRDAASGSKYRGVSERIGSRRASRIAEIGGAKTRRWRKDGRSRPISRTATETAILSGAARLREHDLVQCRIRHFERNGERLIGGGDNGGFARLQCDLADVVLDRDRAEMVDDELVTAMPREIRIELRDILRQRQRQHQRRDPTPDAENGRRRRDRHSRAVAYLATDVAQHALRGGTSRGAACWKKSKVRSLSSSIGGGSITLSAPSAIIKVKAMMRQSPSLEAALARAPRRPALFRAASGRGRRLEI